jgi:hypothetical protein
MKTMIGTLIIATLLLVGMGSMACIATITVIGSKSLGMSWWRVVIACLPAVFLWAHGLACLMEYTIKTLSKVG